MPKAILRPYIAFPFFALLYALIVVFTTQNPLVLATLGDRFVPTELQAFTYSEEGYDGQFGYYVARYGWEAQPYLDVPSYRAQRIALPVLGSIFALGQTNFLVWGMLATNILAMAISIFCLGKLLAERNISVWLTAGYALSIGVFGGTRLLTTEPLAYGLVIGAIFCFIRERFWWGVVCLALSALAKEMTLIFALSYGAYWLREKVWYKAIIVTIMSALPFMLWQGVLYAQFGAFGVGSGGALATSFEFIPLGGFLRILTEGGVGAFLVLAPILILFVLLPTFWGLWQCWRDKAWTIWTFLLFFNALLMLFVPFSTYREILGILRFIVGLQIAVILYATHKRQRRVLTYSTLWFVTSLFVITSDMG
jgi:hypothetical protein